MQTHQRELVRTPRGRVLEVVIALRNRYTDTDLDRPGVRDADNKRVPEREITHVAGEAALVAVHRQRIELEERRGPACQRRAERRHHDGVADHAHTRRVRTESVNFRFPDNYRIDGVVDRHRPAPRAVRQEAQRHDRPSREIPHDRLAPAGQYAAHLAGHFAVHVDLPGDAGV